MSYKMTRSRPNRISNREVCRVMDRYFGVIIKQNNGYYKIRTYDGMLFVFRRKNLEWGDPLITGAAQILTDISH